MVNVTGNCVPIVTGVATIGERAMRMLLTDGTVGDVNFSAEQWTGVLEPLDDPDFFAQVTVDAEAGTIARHNGVDLAPRAAPRTGSGTHARLCLTPRAAGDKRSYSMQERARAASRRGLLLMRRIADTCRQKAPEARSAAPASTSVELCRGEERPACARPGLTARAE
jgi:hypothetical protein